VKFNIVRMAAPQPGNAFPFRRAFANPRSVAMKGSSIATMNLTGSAGIGGGLAGLAHSIST
tara:strand:- start:2780 stop:2962 length:183 start_codon:yes stop_codon:yes gene_type:complete